MNMHIPYSKHILPGILIAASCVCAYPLSTRVPANWEQAQSEASNLKSIGKTDDVEILASPGSVTVRTGKAIRIKVFSILGRVVADNILQPGSYRLQLPGRGIYVVSAGELTCKVAV